MFAKLKNSRGFTIVELLIVIIVIAILATLVITTYNGVQSKARDDKRRTDINAIQGQVEAYNAQYGYYPLASDMNDPTFRTNNLKGLQAPAAIQDPQWKTGNANCTDTTVTPNIPKFQVSATPASGCYGYTSTASDGSTCDNSATPCATYTLTANLEDGTNYQKTGSD